VIDLESGSIFLHYVNLIDKVNTYNIKYQNTNHQTYLFCEKVPDMGNVPELEHAFGISAFIVNANTWGPWHRKRTLVFD
jgi:hypothetical protein